MNLDSIQDSTRYLVKELHYGNIMPGNRKEILRDIFLQSGAYVKGGIYGSELLVNGTGITIDGAIYCKNNIRFDFTESKDKKNVSFNSTVVCSGTLLVPGNGSKVRFLSDVYSGKINLKNCIVYGNVYATSATIENTIVLGGVYCKNDLKLKNSFVFTFRAGHCHLSDHVSILSPFGFADQISMESTINIFTFSSLFNLDNKAKYNGNLKLDETDIYEIELEKNEEFEESEEFERKKIQVLSVAERLLNTSEIIEHFKQNKKFIEFLSLNSHLSEEDRKSFVANNIEEIENELWQIIEKESDFSELNGSKSMDEMFKQYAKAL